MKSETIFIQMVKSTCKEYNVAFIPKRSQNIKLADGSLVGGYFNAGTKELVYPNLNQYYLHSLVHEFSHMQQWIEKTYLWNESEKHGDDIDQWLNGKPIENIFSKIDTLKWLELDCEKRTIKYIKKFNLPINIPSYIQSANSYILFHNYMKETRKWCTDLRHKKLWDICPTSFKPTKYYNTIPKQIYKQFISLDI